MAARAGGDRTNDFSLKYQFLISDTPNEQSTNNGITTFPNAIFLEKTDFNDNGDQFAIQSDELEPDIAISNLSLDLQARYIQKDNTATRFDGNPINSSDIGPIDSLVDTDRVEYKIGNTFSNEQGKLTEFVLVLKDDDTNLDKFQVDGKTIDVAKATSDLNYIIDQNLFNSIDIVRISGLDDGDGANAKDIVSREFPLDNKSYEIIDDPNTSPVAIDDSANTEANTAVTIDVLANDSDPDSNAISIDSFDGTSIQGGSVSLDDNGTTDNSNDDRLIYTPADGFSGSDSFNYTISDGTATATATVNIEVNKGGNVPDPSTDTPGNDLNGGNGKDNLTGTPNNDTLNGGNGKDTLTGLDGNDILLGGNGADELIGGKGFDQLTGGNGGDLFIFAGGDGTDTITDFGDGPDLIGLAGGLTYQDLTFSGNDIIVSNSNQILATLSGVDTTTLSSSDFTLI